MYYLNLEKFLNQPDADLNIMLAGSLRIRRLKASKFKMGACQMIKSKPNFSPFKKLDSLLYGLADSNRC